MSCDKSEGSVQLGSYTNRLGVLLTQEFLEGNRLYHMGSKCLLSSGIMSLRSLSSRKMSGSSASMAVASHNVIQVFDRNAKLLQRERAAKADDVKLFDYLKDEVGFRLSDRILDIKRKFGKALDLGCARGHASKNIFPESVEELILTEFSPTYLEQAETIDGIATTRILMDEEGFSFEPESLDLVISNLSLHWVNDLPALFKSVNDSLKSDGVFLASMFGGDTLYQLRGSLQLAETEREGGIAAHVSPFVDVRDIGALLTRANFTMLTIDTDEIVIGYPSLFELMQDLKGMGEGNAARNRRLRLRKDTIVSAAAIYNELYGKTKDDGSRYIPATFHIFYLVGWKSDPSQPKPLQRGTGEVSLKDLYRLEKIVKDKKIVKVDKDD